MFAPKTTVTLFVLALFSSPAMARYKWLERDNRAVYLNPRRFGQENPEVIQKLSAACPGDVCGNLAGQAITPLLAAQPECSQQDMADDIIDAAAQFDQATADAMIAIAIEYRQAEKNTPPDFSTNPPAARNSVFCQQAPRNAQLNGLVQAQDPANDPNLFFDPATASTVTLGSQANTQPLGGAAAGGNAGGNAGGAANNANGGAAAGDDAAGNNAGGNANGGAANDNAGNGAANGNANNGGANDNTNNGGANNNANNGGGNDNANNGGANNGNAGAANGNAGNAGGAGGFGSCSTPEIEFGAGFDNRKETSFQPADQISFPHTSAQNIGIITEFICDTLVNTCGADQAALDQCAQATAAASAATKNSGAQADAFNAVFGITTNFVNDQVIDNTGAVVARKFSGFTRRGRSTARWAISRM